MNHPDELWSDSGADTERLVFFSDAIFAVALTLLVIDLRVPEVEDPAQLPAALLALWPNLLSLLISFFVISFYWRAHHRVFHLIERYDRRLIGLNFIFLLCIVLQPFTTDLISRHGTQPVAVMVYAGLLALAGLLLTAIWVYASAGRRLIALDLDARLVRFYTLRTLVPSLIFLASAPLALAIDPTWVPWAWLLIIPVRSFLRWRLAPPAVVSQQARAEKPPARASEPQQSRRRR